MRSETSGRTLSQSGVCVFQCRNSSDKRVLIRWHEYGGGGETNAQSFSGYGSGNLAGISIEQVHEYAPKAEVRA